MPTTQKTFKNITDSLDGDTKIVAADDAADAPNTADDDYGYIYSKTSQYELINRNYSPNNSDGYAASLNDAASHDSLIYSKLKHKTDPRSMIELKKITNTVTDVDTVDNNA